MQGLELENSHTFPHTEWLARSLLSIGPLEVLLQMYPPFPQSVWQSLVCSDQSDSS